MYSRNDPRLRQRLNEISQTIESANESARVNIFTFSQAYITPCWISINDCFEPCVNLCYRPRDPRGRQRPRRGAQGRAELNFDFYDDWDDDESDALLGWSNHEHDSLLGGSSGAAGGPVAGTAAYGTNMQPGRQRQMVYGSRKDPKDRRKSNIQLYQAGSDPNVIPAPSYFGFFGKLTNKLGGRKVLRYKPSAADLQDHPGASKPKAADDETNQRPGRRKRSGTTGSRETIDSLSSRGDIFPSDDEDDAVPLDDEFAMVLERRTTNSAKDDSSSGGRRQRHGNVSSPTASTPSSRVSRQSSRQTLDLASTADVDVSPATEASRRSDTPSADGKATGDEAGHS